MKLTVCTAVTAASRATMSEMSMSATNASSGRSTGVARSRRRPDATRPIRSSATRANNP